MFDLLETPLSGLMLLKPKLHLDDRGSFVKTFVKSAFADMGLHREFPEEFYSCSKAGVIRGMHFQQPPDELFKLVSCVSGRTMSVILDIRAGSPTYGRYYQIGLSAESPVVVYIPPGFANGFCALEDHTIITYKTSTEYSPKNDMAIHWDSFGCQWPVDKPVLSPRDEEAIPLNDYNSPFTMG